MVSHWSIIGSIIGALAGLVAIHKFIIRRPRLRLVGETTGYGRRESTITGNLSVYIENSGWKNANDVYLEIHSNTWDFPNDADIDGENSILDFQHDNHGYIGAPGDRHRFKIDDTLHPGSKYKLFFGDILLEQDRDYTIDYRISCQSHGERKGELWVKSGYNNVSVVPSPPRFYLAYWKRIKDIVRNIIPYSPVSLTLPNVWISAVKLESVQESFWDWRVNPIIEVRTANEKDVSAYSVTVKGVVKISNNGEKEAVGAIKMKRCSVRPGTNAIILMTDINKYAKQRLACDSSYDAYKQIPLKYSPQEPPYPDHPHSDLDIQWEVDYEIPEQGDQRGFQILCSEMEVKKLGDQNMAKIKGTIENTNTNSRAFFVVGRVYTDSGYLVATPDQRIQIAGNSKTDFNVSCYIPQLSEDLTDHEVVLQRTQ